MRAILVVTVFALLTVMPVVQAQEGALPPCAAAEIATMHDSVSGIYNLFQSASDIRTMDDLLAYSQDHLEWRESLWSNWPKCSRGFEISLLANQLIGDYVALILINSLAEDVEENPYLAVRDSGVARLEALWNDVPLPDEVVDARTSGETRACTSSEIQFIRHTLLPEYDRLTETANSVEDIEGFLAYARALLVWRADSLLRYPPCAEAIEFAWWTSQTGGDIAALFAFYAIGLPEDEIPYSEPERLGTGRLRELRENLPSSPTTPVDGGSLPDEVMRVIERELGNPGGGNWRACSAGELETILNIIPEYENLTALAGSIESIDDLLAYSSEMIRWRERLVSELAHCGEVLEVAWIMSEYIGDLAAMHAYASAGIPADESPVFQQFMSNVGAVRTWSKVLTDLVNHRESEPEAQPGSGSLPDCTSSELDTINRMLADHYALYDAAGVIETLEGYVAFTEAQLAWREVQWARLPLCGDSFEYLLRMNWTNNDSTVGGVLHFFADVPYEDNPYWPAASGFKERADVLLNRLRGVEASQ